MHLFNWGFWSSLPAKFPLFLLSLGVFVHSLLGMNNTVYVEQAPSAVPSPVHATTTPSVTAPNPATSTNKVIKPVAAPVQVPTQKQYATKLVSHTTTTPATQIPQTLDLPSVQASSALIEELNTETRGALVNILCTTAAGGYFAPISGSGVFIDSRGIILTNSHVAEYFLLKDYPFTDNIHCVIRTGSPAQPLYTAELLFIPPAWISANAEQLTAQRPSGTGENDYAFLRVTGTVSSSVAMPVSFPALKMSATAPQEGAPALLVAYPAGLLDGQTIQMNLYSSSAVSTVQTLYSFDGSQNVDLIGLKGTVVSQTGSSGGALIGVGSGRLLGIIATESAGTTTSDRQLNAVTIAHIDRSLVQSGMGGLNTFLMGDAAQKAADFNKNVAPLESAELEAVLKKVAN